MDRIAAVLDEIEEFLEGQQDVRDGEDGPLPNKAMSLLTELQAARSSTAPLDKIIADLKTMRKGEAEGVMMMANSDDTMFEDCIRRLKALSAIEPLRVKEVWMVSSRTFMQIFDSQESAKAFISQFGAAEGGGMSLTNHEVFSAAMDVSHAAKETK